MSKDPFCSFASKCIFLSSDEDAQKGCAGLNVFSMQCRIEDTKFQGEVKEKRRKMSRSKDQRKSRRKMPYSKIAIRRKISSLKEG